MLDTNKNGHECTQRVDVNFHFLLLVAVAVARHFSLPVSAYTRNDGTKNERNYEKPVSGQLVSSVCKYYVIGDERVPFRCENGRVLNAKLEMEIVSLSPRVDA